MAKVKAYCKTCKEMIDITEIPFVNMDEMPIVLDMQLRQPGRPPTERRAINFVKRHGVFDFEDWGDSEEKMYHYSKPGDMSHEEPGDESHNLDITGGYWSTE